MTLLTEKEAAEKWCPMAVNSTQLRGDSGRALPECIGSRCMAWRWHKTNVKFEDLSEEDRRFAESPDHGDLVPAWRTYGYCGAFGKEAP